MNFTKIDAKCGIKAKAAIYPQWRLLIYIKLIILYYVSFKCKIFLINIIINILKKKSGEMMDYPKKLLEEVKERSKGMRLEGINSGSGSKHPLLMIVGEAPGRNEIVNNIPFSGDAGKELDKSLKQIGLLRDQVYITSAVRSRPFSMKKVFSKRENKEVIKRPNRKPTKKEVLAHAPFLDYEISYADPQIIVALGNTGLERLLGPGHKISAEHGKVIENTPILELNTAKDGYVWSKKKYTVIPEYHPAAVFYNRKLSDDIVKDWEVIKPYIDKERESNE